MSKKQSSSDEARRREFLRKLAELARRQKPKRKGK